VIRFEAKAIVLKALTGFWIVVAVIYGLIGIGLGSLVKGRTKWSLKIWFTQAVTKGKSKIMKGIKQEVKL
jgi:hypothetical protein